MTIEPLKLLAEFHGHLGWLAAAALLHPAILLGRRDVRNPNSKLGLTLSLATAFVTAAAISGALIYDSYRQRIRPHLFHESPTIGWMFERKEHLALGAAVLAWAGVLAAVAARREKSDDVGRKLARGSRLAFVVASALASVSAILGTWVASVRSF